MEIAHKKRGGKVQLTLAGDLDIYVVAEVHDHLSQALADGETVTVDLAGVDNIDGAGVQLLMANKREATRLGKTLQLQQHSAGVIEAFELCQLERFFGDPLVLRPKRTAKR